MIIKLPWLTVFANSIIVEKLSPIHMRFPWLYKVLHVEGSSAQSRRNASGAEIIQVPCLRMQRVLQQAAAPESALKET